MPKITKLELFPLQHIAIEEDDIKAINKLSAVGYSRAS